MADCPCQRHQDAFLNALGNSEELFFKAVATTQSAHTVQPHDELQLANVEADDQTFVLAFPNLDAAQRHDPLAVVVAIDLAAAIRMTLTDHTVDGILIATAGDNDAWAAAPRESLQQLLTN